MSNADRVFENALALIHKLEAEIACLRDRLEAALGLLQEARNSKIVLPLDWDKRAVALLRGESE